MNCRICGIASTRKFCGNCGAELSAVEPVSHVPQVKKSEMGGYFFVLLGLGVLLFLVWASSNTQTAAITGNSTTTHFGCLEPLGNVLDREGSLRFIVGTVANNCDRSYRLAEIKFNLYDDAMAQVGTARASVENLEPHGKWSYKAYISEESAAKFRFKEIVGY